MYKWCAVPLCKSTSIKTPRKLFVCVPDKITMRNKWLNLARRDHTALSPNSRLHFCEDHFDLEEDMENYMRYKIMGSVPVIRMRPQCVPSRFDCQADEKNRATSDPWLFKRKRKSIVKMDEDVKGEGNQEISSRPPTRQQAPNPAMAAPSTEYTGFQDTYIQSLLKTHDVQKTEQSRNEINEVPINKTKSRCHRPNRKVAMLRKARKKVTHPVTTVYVPNIVRTYNIENVNLKLTEEFKGLFYEILKVLTADTNTIAITDLSRAINENKSLRAVNKSQFTWDDDIYELLEQTCDYECVEKRGVYYIVINGFNTPDCGAEIKAPHLKDDVECELQMKIELEEETFTPGTNTNVETIDSGHLLSADRVKVEIEEDTGTNTNFTAIDSYLPYTCDRMVKIEDGELPALQDDESSLPPAKRTKEKPNTISTPANDDIAPSRLRPVYCFVPECQSNSKDFPDKLYFTVPFIGNLREKWLKVVGRDTNSAHLSLKCCSDHFDLEKDTEIWVRNKNRGEDVKIKKGVLPHKFECQQRTMTLAPSSDEVGKSAAVMEAYYKRRYNTSCLMYCFVPFCKSNSKACPDKLFFAVPENKRLRAEWMKAVGRNELSMKSKILTCCSDHFDLSKDIQEQVKKNERKYPKLKKGVIPHKFQCQHRIRRRIKTIKRKKKKPTVQRERKEIMKPVADDDDKNMAEYTGSTDTASEKDMDSQFPSDNETFDNTRPKGEPILCQCSSCGDFMSDVRYRCLQCSWRQCAACEARGAHRPHCVVRAPPRCAAPHHAEIKSMMRNLKSILQNKNFADNDDWRMDAVEDGVKPDMRVNEVPTVTKTEFYNGFQEEHIPYDYEEIITSDKETVFYDSSLKLQPQHPINTQSTIKIPLTNAFTKETEQTVLKRPQVRAGEDIKKAVQSTGQNQIITPPQVFISNPRSLTSKTSTVTQNEMFLNVTSGPAKSSTKTSRASPDIQDTPKPFAR